MKLLIVYESGNGSVKTAVEYLLTRLLHADVTVADLAKETPKLDAYNVIVAGSSVRFAKLRKPMRRFLEQNEPVLLKKSVALFFCCGLMEEQDYYSEKLFSPALQKAAFHIACFGGSLNTEGLKLWDKLLVKSMRSRLLEQAMDDGTYVAELPYLLPENVDEMANAVLDVINRQSSRKSV